jgi:phosphoribosylaminoimidazolecarboxamide formyltransferase/IMP cyclohydrolase
VRALISVHDKAGLVPFARGLAELGCELVASGGTAAALEEAGLSVTRVEDVTGFPELLGGRVKTLHPRIHAGILARRELEEDVAALAEHGIAPFDLVCVRLYPFEQTADAPDARDEDVVEMIDVGGPALLRAAAKSHEHVTPVCRLAAAAFAATAAYDAAIARWFQRGDDFPETLVPAFDRSLELSYGENPHQRAAYYVERGARTHLLAQVQQLQGKPLSFNNLNDLSAARLVVRELDRPACVVVKHAVPCGVAVGDTIENAYRLALAADPVSAYGGVVVLNRAVTAALGELLAGQFVEVLFAPGYDEQAMESLARRTATRVLNDTERRAFAEPARDYRRVLGGLLVQDGDRDVATREGMDVVCGTVGDEQWQDALFAWRVVKHVRSNAVVLARGGQTIGIGGGQTSRVDAVRIAVEKARELGHETDGAVLASDAFFPFADGPRIALEAGVAVLVQPGGSKRDGEVMDAVEGAGAAMVFTHRRHFRH